MLKRLTCITLLACFVLLGGLTLSGCGESSSKPTPVVQPPPPNVTEEDVLPPSPQPPIISTSPDGNYQLEIDGWDNLNRGARMRLIIGIFRA